MIINSNNTNPTRRIQSFNSQNKRNNKPRRGRGKDDLEASTVSPESFDSFCIAIVHLVIQQFVL